MKKYIVRTNTNKQFSVFIVNNIDKAKTYSFIDPENIDTYKVKYDTLRKAIRAGIKDNDFSSFEIIDVCICEYFDLISDKFDIKFSYIGDDELISSCNDEYLLEKKPIINYRWY